MNKVELINEVAQSTGFTKKDIKQVLESVQNVTYNAL